MTTVSTAWHSNALRLILPALHRGRPIVREHEHQWGAPWPAVKGGTVHLCQVPNCGASRHEADWS